MSPCDVVAEQIALGHAGPLAADLGEHADHVASCERCQRVVALAGTLASTRRDVDPGLGFAARMTVGAQHRLVARRRQRVAVGLAATVAAGVIGVFLFTRSPAPPDSTVATETRPTPTQPDPDHRTDPAADEDLKALIRFADVDRSSRLSARWSHIEKPLAPYRKLLQGVTP